MTPGPVTHLRREQVAHLLRAAAAIANQQVFVLIGTGAVIAQLRDTPFALMATRELDLYAPEPADVDRIADLIDGSIGEGSTFDTTFGYYAHGVGPETAVLPVDWSDRARRFTLPSAPGVECICPAVDDIALAKLCAWREKDRDWLRAASMHGVLDLPAMRSAATKLPTAVAPDQTEIDRRMEQLERCRSRST